MTGSESPTESNDGVSEQPLSKVRLVGFSPRDGELLKIFLRRPPGAGTSLEVVDDINADLLIANMSHPDSVMAVRRRNRPGRTIGLVSQFTTDAPYYQVQQNSQLLYSLAQALNRIRDGWYPPHLAQQTPATPAAPDTSTADAEPENGAEDANPAVTASAASVAAKAVTPTASASHAGEALPWRRSLSILVVDDSNFSRVAIQEALGKVGFAVETAIDGEEGLRMATAKHYDVALVDFEMPGIKGPEVIRRMRGLGANAPQLLIMLTSRTGAVDRLRAKIAGCDAYLTKPTKMSEFIAVLTQFAGQGKLKRS
jgi:CheY-like chemotaxis protein